MEDDRGGPRAEANVTKGQIEGKDEGGEEGREEGGVGWGSFQQVETQGGADPSGGIEVEEMEEGSVWAKEIQDGGGGGSERAPGIGIAPAKAKGEVRGAKEGGSKGGGRRWEEGDAVGARGDLLGDLAEEEGQVTLRKGAFKSGGGEESWGGIRLADS